MTDAQLQELRKVAEKAHKSMPGPYFVSADDAHDVPDHKDSGLSMVDTGRSADWWVARLCEWPTCLALLDELLHWRVTVRDKAKVHEAAAEGSLPNDQTAARSTCAARVLRETEKVVAAGHRRDCGMPSCFICYGGK